MVTGRVLNGLASAAVTLLLFSCTPQLQDQRQHVDETTTGLPEAFYKQAAKDSANQVFRVDTQQSLLTIKVFRGGPLAKMGHDHIVASRDIQGYILSNNSNDSCRADVIIPLQNLSVDEPGLRRDAGFETQPSDVDIAGTRKNMVEKVLNPTAFPFINISVKKCPQKSIKTLPAEVFLMGVRQVIPAELTTRTEGEHLIIRGSAKVLQSDFGIEPFSVMGGLLKVEDKLEINFLIISEYL